MSFFDILFPKKEEHSNIRLYAPMEGQAVPLSEVPDITFSEKLLGDGIAIIPASGKVYAPCDGTVDNAFHTGHAITMTTKSGAELLIHIGLETVSLEGNPFKVHVKNGDKVKKGQLLIEADLDAIKAVGLNTITPMLVCNIDDYSDMAVVTGKTVTTDDMVVEIVK